jgi:hypothetical protein
VDTEHAKLARWIAARTERLLGLTAADGVALGLDPREARRLLARAGFSLYLDGQRIRDVGPLRAPAPSTADPPQRDSACRLADRA